jgi:hypothetical protein
VEVRVLAEMVGKDATSTTGNNVIRMRQETGLDPWSVTAKKFRDNLSVREVPAEEVRKKRSCPLRLGLFRKMMITIMMSTTALL